MRLMIDLVELCCSVTVGNNWETAQIPFSSILFFFFFFLLLTLSMSHVLLLNVAA